MSDIDELVTAARRHAGMTAAEFDYSLAFGAHRAGELHNAYFALSSAAYLLATESLPAVDETTSADDLARRHQLGRNLLESYRADLDAMIAAARAKTYNGWSSASGGPISYA